ncbi:19606_t:CDS:2, partial [Racocetra fulgida]
KYGHFYARRLILGGAIMNDEEYTKNSAMLITVRIRTYCVPSKAKLTKAQGGVEIAANILEFEVNAVHDKNDMHNNYNIHKNNFETIVGGDDSQNDKDLWIQSLNDATKWKIIGYENVYSLFELLEDELKEKVLSVMGHQILD